MSMLILNENAYNTNQKHVERSARYTHVTTKNLGDIFTNHGFDLVKYSQSRVVDKTQESHAKHIVKFRHSSDTLKIGDTKPELIVKNDGLGKGSLKISFGLYRLVCANGLVVGNSFFNFKFNHDKNILTNLDVAIPKILNQSDVLREQVSRLSSLGTTEDQRLELSRAALDIMLQNSNYKIQSIDLNQFLKVRRWDDNKQDAWTVFNRVQENVFRSNVRAIVLNDENIQEYKTIRKVGESSQRAIDINKSLWNASESIFNMKVGA
jgi:hypothetical protein